jgi:spore coat protein U-like protein
MTPFRLLLVAMVATLLLVGARPGAGAQFPRGLLAGAPGPKDPSACTIETRPLSFGNYDPEANAEVDALAQVIYICNKKKGIRIEMAPGASNQFDRYMTSGQDRLNYNIYLDSTHRTIWGNGTSGTSAYIDDNPPKDTPVVIPAYGRIPARQSPQPGQYVDVLNVVILF